jgi:glycosyltransferase involved in cell wall biosynthesis
MKIIIFGLGRFYRRHIEEIKDTDEIIALIDNNAENIKFSNGKKVYTPDAIMGFDYDYVLLMVAQSEEIEKQLITIGISKLRILRWYEYMEYMKIKKHDISIIANGISNGGKKIIIITDPLLYNGGALAAINVGKALLEKKYDITIASYQADERLVKEIQDMGISVAIISQLLPMTWEEAVWCQKFDFAIVNVFPMLNVACILGQIMPTLWWVHESSNKYYAFYEYTRMQYKRYDDIELIKKVWVIAVSSIAKNNFEEFYPNTVKSIVPVCISDRNKLPLRKNNEKNNKKYVVSLIGPIMHPKGQLVLINAMNKMTLKTEIECLFIGKIEDRDYYDELTKQSDGLDISFKGVLDLERMQSQYEKIDVVVCASYEETLSLTIVEGMMNSKICITTDETGIAEYIEDGVNGFICKAGDEDSLAEKLQFVLEHYDDLDFVKRNARATYEKYFTLNVLGERFEQEIMKLEKVLK